MRAILRGLSGLGYAIAALAWLAVIVMSLRGDAGDATSCAVLADICAIVGFLAGAFVAKSWVGAISAAGAVAFFLTDALVRLMSGFRIDSDVPVPQLFLYNHEVVFPVVNFLLIIAMSFALRKTARLAWIVGVIVGVAGVIVGAIGHDSTVIAIIWYAAVAFNLVRPFRGSGGIAGVGNCTARTAGNQ